MKNLLILMSGLCWLVCLPAQLPGQKVQARNFGSVF